MYGKPAADSGSDKRQRGGSHGQQQKLKGKHRQPKNHKPLRAAGPFEAARAQKYGLDYSRFDVDSDDSDAERQALAAPESCGAAAPPDPPGVRDGTRARRPRVVALRGEALGTARAAGGRWTSQKAAPMTAKVSTKKASQRESAARRAIAEARAELEAAQRGAADARAKAGSGRERIKRSSDVEAAQRRAGGGRSTSGARRPPAPSSSGWFVSGRLCNHPQRRFPMTARSTSPQQGSRAARSR